MSLEDMIQSISYTVWVDKKTFIINRAKSDVKMVLTVPETGDIHLSLVTEVKIYDVDKQVNIVLPEKANLAKEINPGLNMPTGNVAAGGFE